MDPYIHVSPLGGESKRIKINLAFTYNTVWGNVLEV